MGITHYGWVNRANNDSGKMDCETAVKWLEGDEVNRSAHVVDKSDGSKVYCYVRQINNGTKFLQTYANDTYTDNLLSLPECRG
jgi:hypothetical protein